MGSSKAATILKKNQPIHLSVCGLVFMPSLRPFIQWVVFPWKWGFLGPMPSQMGERMFR